MNNFNDEEFYSAVAKLLYDVVKENNFTTEEMLLLNKKTIERAYNIALKEKNLEVASKFKEFVQMSNKHINKSKKNELDNMLDIDNDDENNYQKSA